MVRRISIIVAVTALAVSAVHSQSTGVPVFEVDPSWPKGLPNNWTFGEFSGVAVDSHDHIWINQRPRTLADDEKYLLATPPIGDCCRPGPSIMEFDQAGNFVQGWGGPGQGFEWPENEHGVYVDDQDNVWVGGNGAKDNHILKFTKTGTFILQIGRLGQSKGSGDTANLNRPSKMFVNSKTNDVFVSDGYGNRRVIVFDADTGAYKRMWGAFGNMPTDGAPDLSQADVGANGSPQFIQPVHAARVSNDGLVYVSDRGGKRVQVFTLDGKFVSQVFIGRDCRAPDCGNGTTAASTAFSPDAAQRFLFVGNRSQAKVMVFDRKTLALLDSFGRWGSAPGEFGTLHHMAADSKGNLYVTEVTPLKPENRRIQKFTYTGLQAPAPQGAAKPDLAVISARLGTCSADFTVTDAAGAPVYAAAVHVRIRYGFMSLKRMDLEVGTDSGGKARVEGLPEKAKPLVYDITKDNRKATVEQDLSSTCLGTYQVFLK
jgi:DNA-binding beta-propeller fold protein YncE